MKVYTIQSIDFWKTLMRDGIVYCNQESYWCQNFRLQYDWMAEQMRKRIGEPPLPEIKYPVWVWQQFNSKKAPTPKMSPKEINPEENEAVMMELEVPDNEVLLSNLNLWMLPLNSWAISSKRENKMLYQELGEYEKTHGKCFTMTEYPPAIRQKIIDSWVRVFDLDTFDPYRSSHIRKNRSIQGTIWYLRKEWVKVAHVFNRHSEIKRIVY